MVWLESILGGAVVLVGVVAARWVERQSEFRREIESDVLELSSLMTWVATGYVVDDGSIDTAVGSEWWEKRQRVWQLVHRLQINSRRVRRNRARIKKALEDYLTVFAAADSMFVLDEKRPPRKIVIDLSSTQLQAAVFGESEDRPEQRWDRVQALKKRWESLT